MAIRGRYLKPGIIIVILTILLILAAQPAASSQPDVSPPTPEPYPGSDRYPAEVELPGEAALNILYRLEINLEGVRHGPAGELIATVYVSPQEAETLRSLGLEAVPIPNQGYRAYLAYGPGAGEPPQWPSFPAYVERMQTLEAWYPGIVDLVQIGTSVQGRGLYCLEITDNPGVDEFEPEFRYSAAHHGDEATGIEMTMLLAEVLAMSYGNDPALTALVEGLEIWICPIYNPDGYVLGTRWNYNGVDLNRDYPDRFTDPSDDPSGREPETQAFMQFAYAHRFVMGMNYHGGAQVLNYPWDAVAAPGHPIVPAYAPDDGLFFTFGYGYTSRNPDLFNSPTFPYGLTRGWEWYQIWGGMQDWAYYYHGEHHVTLEVSNTKKPDFPLMPEYWLRNEAAMEWWLAQALSGMGGLVLDANTSAPLAARVSVEGMQQPNFADTDPDLGDYHRVIVAGSYTITASAPGYYPQSALITVISGTKTLHDFYLLPFQAPDISPSSKAASLSQAQPGTLVEYWLRLENAGMLTSTASLTDTLPAGLTWSGYLTATQGIPVFDNGQVLWQGPVAPTDIITVTYSVTLDPCQAAGTALENVMQVFDGVTTRLERSAILTVLNSSPGMPEAPSPADGAANVPMLTQLTWAPSSDANCDSLTYDVAFGTSSPPPVVASGLVSPVFDPGPLSAGSTYYWEITVQDGLTQTQGPQWSFTSLPGRTYLPLALRQ